jgi:uncharacterized phiE125 gp8 family phage protein
MMYADGCSWGVTRPLHWAARVVTPPIVEPITPAELIERARMQGTDAESSALLADYIAAARAQVEQDTGCALLSQTIAISVDGVPTVLPWPPLQAVATASYLDAAGVSQPMDPATYRVDTLSFPARIWFSVTPAGPVTLELLVGWTQQTLPPPLKQAVGLLATHYLTLGRDRVVIGTAVEDMPAGYAEAIRPYTLEVLA